MTMPPLLADERNGLAVSLNAIRHEPLKNISAGLVGKVVRRIVDHDAVAPKLEVAAFNSAI